MELLLKKYYKIKAFGLEPLPQMSLRALLIVILENAYNISNTHKFFIIHVLKMVETFLRITVKHTLKMCLVVILGSVFNISNILK